MWTNQELKARGLAAFKGNYWKSVVSALILSFTVGSAVGTVSSSSSARTGGASVATVDQETARAMIPIIIGILTACIIALIVYEVIGILVLRPLEVGCKKFFLRNSEMTADLNEITSAFRENWKGKVLTMFLRDIYLMLWSMLCVIPGIVKGYSYRMVPYILADHPEMSGNEVIALSRQMMDGQKMKVFFLDLSFIGWILLSVITFGIAGVFYTSPYMAATDAELYQALKSQANLQ